MILKNPECTCTIHDLQHSALVGIDKWIAFKKDCHGKQIELTNIELCIHSIKQTL